jgi:branched-subunit amino acid ABC-type transport system permease component
MNATVARLQRWWNDYWFPTTSTLNLAGARIVAVAAEIFWLFPGLPGQINLLTKNQQFSDPQPLVRFLSAVLPRDVIFSPGGFTVIYWVSMIAGVAALVGLATRLSLFLLTFGLTLILQDLIKARYTVSSVTVQPPAGLLGEVDLGLFRFPTYRVVVLGAAAVVCLGVWWLLTRTRIGMVGRAATERPELTRAFGIDVGRWVTPVFGFGIALAGLAGVLAAPMRAINPLMGSDLIIVVFAVVVIGGMGSIMGAILTGFGLGVVEGLTKVFYPEASNTVIFVIMVLVLLVKPAGLFGKER